MNKISTALAALLMTASVGAMAETTTTNTTRDQRMNAALQDYRSGNGSSDTSTNGMRRKGTFERAEDSAKSGTRKAGHAIAEGSRTAGHAVAQGARKTGHAVHKATDKATGNTPSSTSP